MLEVLGLSFGPAPPGGLVGQYNPGLVLLSVLVASIASYSALDLAGRVTHSEGRAARLWLLGGAMAMGAGIWSMHFIGMLAFSLPVRLAYDLVITLASMVIAMVISGFALAVVSRRTLSLRLLLAGGLIMGLGICAMHYTGMAAMRMSPPIRYDPLLFTASVLIAVGASIVALFLAFTLRTRATGSGILYRALSAIVMGLAITGMHYTGMAAANYEPGSLCLATSAIDLANETLAYVIAAVVLSLLVVTLIASIFDARMAGHTMQMLRQVEQANVGLKREIEERKRIEDALEKEREFLKTMLNSLSEGIVACDEKGILTLFNRATREMHGLPEEPIPSEAWAEHYDLFLADGRTRMSKEQIPLFRALSGEAFQNVEMVIAPKHRPRRVLLCGGQPIVTATGRKLGAVVALHDITESKAATEELERSNMELERFAYVASHDLQAPLRGISGFAQLLKQRYGQDALDQDAREFIQFIVEGTQSMQLLIQGLLDFSRAGRGGANREPVALAQTIEVAKAQLRAMIDERHAQIECGALPTLEVDPAQIALVMQNLIENAIKFQTGDQPVVKITARHDAAEWVVSVTDSGIGIDPQHNQRIFQIFKRLHTEDIYPGSGIGLAICEKIVHLHGGRIWVESEPGKGSTFSFSIPDTGSSMKVT